MPTSCSIQTLKSDVLSSRWSDCPAGSSALHPCTAGRYATSAGLASLDQCIETTAGHYAAVGSALETSCSPGSYANSTGWGGCAACAAGTFQPASEGTACRACVAGSHCAPGASAALPCPGGRFSSHTSLGSASQCIPCPAGTFCFAGATSPVNCSAGSHSPLNSSKLCTACPVETYQPSPGQSSCLPCGAGYSCTEGSSVQLPASCDGGSYIPAGVTYSSEADCLGCTPGFE